jgi:hypothetical protein
MVTTEAKKSRKQEIKNKKEPFPKLMRAFFAPGIAPQSLGQKTGLSAPIPRICPCKSCGISAAIPCAPRAFQVLGNTRKKSNIPSLIRLPRLCGAFLEFGPLLQSMTAY